MGTRRQELSREQKQKEYEKYRIKILPDQLERARLRVKHLEREAERLGLNHLLRSET
jgi:hypothetical protein